MRIEQIFNGLESLAQLCHNQSITAKTKYAHDLWDDMDSIATEALALLKTHPEAQQNEPLTQKQLQFMSSAPVWIVREDGADRWALIRYANSGGINTYGCGFLAWEDLGKLWLAYRRPPKEET